MMKRNYVFAGTKRERPDVVLVVYRGADLHLLSYNPDWVDAMNRSLDLMKKPHVKQVAHDYKSLGRIYLN